MSSNDYNNSGSGHGYGQANEYGQPQRQSYSGSQLPPISSINPYSQGTYQQGPGRSTVELPPLNLTGRITSSPYPTNNSPLPPFSSLLRIAEQPSYRSTQASSITSLRSPANSNVTAAYSQPGTTSQSQRHQRSTMDNRGNEGTYSMQHFPAGITTSNQSSPPPSGRSERDVGTSSSRQTKREQYRRNHKAKSKSKSHSPRPIVSTEPHPSLQDYSDSLQRYLTHVENPQAFGSNSYSTENMPADSDMECRRPECKERISTTALFGACQLHHDQLSTWDFSYCEAEMTTRSHPEGFFHNGQCRNEKIAFNCRMCRHHSTWGYSWRTEFRDSNCLKDGKWFEGRHEGNADLPPGYGTSGAQSYSCYRNGR